jgi:hypothetical protein
LKIIKIEPVYIDRLNFYGIIGLVKYLRAFN